MPDHSEFVAQIEAYCRDTGMAETYLGRLAANDGKVIARIRRGGRVWPETLDKISQFMAANPPSREAAE